MKIFIFEDVMKLTTLFHGGGSLLIIADSLDKALEMTKNSDIQQIREWIDIEIKLSEEEIEKVKVFELAGNPEPQIFVFPDAGCC